ncbi:17477_t:CDS:2 [Racocetra persica]|uniref:17477_t:CDS:1 n=1 Tax=Racocetra persica TaxID=160502 RepID=A0ACA9K864_9GLOM|nr:17477_t:CDS:2 [Racocetra persica]
MSKLPNTNERFAENNFFESLEPSELDYESRHNEFIISSLWLTAKLLSSNTKATNKILANVLYRISAALHLLDNVLKAVYTSKPLQTDQDTHQTWALIKDQAIRTISHSITYSRSNKVFNQYLKALIEKENATNKFILEALRNKSCASRRRSNTSYNNRQTPFHPNFRQTKTDIRIIGFTNMIEIIRKMYKESEEIFLTFLGYQTFYNTDIPRIDKITTTKTTNNKTYNNTVSINNHFRNQRLITKRGYSKDNRRYFMFHFTNFRNPQEIRKKLDRNRSKIIQQSLKLSSKTATYQYSKAHSNTLCTISTQRSEGLIYNNKNRQFNLYDILKLPRRDGIKKIKQTSRKDIEAISFSKLEIDSPTHPEQTEYFGRPGIKENSQSL